jgi:hypothetical protein
VRLDDAVFSPVVFAAVQINDRPRNIGRNQIGNLIAKIVILGGPFVPVGDDFFER